MNRPDLRSNARLLFCAAALTMTACTATAPLPPKAVELNQTGAAALAAGDLAVAEARLNLALEYNPRFTEAWVNLGLVELRRGNFQQSYKFLKKARELNEDLPAPHHALGLLFETRGMLKEAEHNYREALKVDPGFAAARINLGRLLFARGAMDDAEEQFLRLTQVAPEVMEGWTSLAECLWQLRRDPEADEVVAKARQRFGDAPEVTMLVGRQELRAEAYGDAEKSFLRIVGHPDPTRRAYAYAWLAYARLGLGLPKEAEEAAKSALAIDRDQAVASHAMGLALRQLGDPRAEGWIERSQALSQRGTVQHSENVP